METIFAIIVINVVFWGLIALIYWIFTVNTIAGILSIIEFVGWIIVISRYPGNGTYEFPKEHTITINEEDSIPPNDFPHSGGGY